MNCWEALSHLLNQAAELEISEVISYGANRRLSNLEIQKNKKSFQRLVWHKNFPSLIMDVQPIQ